MQKEKIGDVLLYRPSNCPYLSVAQLCAETSVSLNTKAQWSVTCYAYYDYLLTENETFDEQTMLTKNIIFMSSCAPAALGNYKNLGNFRFHKDIPPDIATRLPPPMKSVGFGFEKTLVGASGGMAGVYFGYSATMNFGRAVEYTYFVLRNMTVVARILNNPCAIYRTTKICGDHLPLSGRYSNGGKTKVEVHQENGGYCDCELDYCPMLSRLAFEVGDLFYVPLSDGKHCTGQLIYYDHDIGPVVALFKDNDAYPNPERLLTIAAILPWHFRWNLWPIYDNGPPLVDYNFAAAAATKWSGWERYDSSHVQQFAEACHGLAKWQKGCFDRLLLNPEFKPAGIEEVEIELKHRLRKPLFEMPEELKISKSTSPVQMSLAKFWKIIQESKEKAEGDNSERQMEVLTEILAATSLKEIEKFNNRFYSYFFRAYTWKLWGAAFVALKGCSDDGFIDFRGWLIAQGKEIFESALKDPDSLADYKPLENPGIMEGFSYCASDAYEQLGGDELDYEIAGVCEEPKGKAWTEKELPELYPRLWQKFWITDTGATVNAKKDDGTVSIKTAFFNPDPEAIKILIEVMTDVNAIIEDDKNALIFVAEGNPNPEIIKLIVAAGGNVNTTTKEGNSPLIYAVTKNHNPGVIKALVEAGADVNVRNKKNFTVLMHAAEYNSNPEVIRILFEAGADVNAKKENDINALMLASSHNTNPEIIKALLSAGADVNEKSQSLTPLMFAALNNPEPEIIKTLVEAGADLKAKASGEATVLNFAQQNKNPQVAEMVVNLY